MNHSISANFTYEELFASDTASAKGIANIPETMSNCISLCSNISRLGLLLQRVRDVVGLPIRVTSGYRTPKLNSALPNSSSTSYHMLGAAADIKCKDMAKLLTTLEYLKEETKYRNLPLFRIVKEPTWYHIQLEPVSIQHLSFFEFFKHLYG